jgi:hypothetical protein
MGLEKEFAGRGLNPQGPSHSPRFGGESNLPFPSADMLDGAVGENDIKA